MKGEDNQKQELEFTWENTIADLEDAWDCLTNHFGNRIKREGGSKKLRRCIDIIKAGVDEVRDMGADIK